MIALMLTSTSNIIWDDIDMGKPYFKFCTLEFSQFFLEISTDEIFLPRDNLEYCKLLYITLAF